MYFPQAQATYAAACVFTMIYLYSGDSFQCEILQHIIVISSALTRCHSPLSLSFRVGALSYYVQTYAFFQTPGIDRGTKSYIFDKD